MAVSEAISCEIQARHFFKFFFCNLRQCSEGKETQIVDIENECSQTFSWIFYILNNVGMRQEGEKLVVKNFVSLSRRCTKPR